MDKARLDAVRRELNDRRTELLPRLLEMLQADSPRERLTAAVLVGLLDELGPDAGDIRQALVSSLTNALYGIPARCAAAEALGRHAEGSAAIANVLGMELARATDYDYAYSIAQALRAIGPEAFHALVEAARGRNGAAAYQAISALQDLGPDAVAPLTDLVISANPRDRCMVISGLGRLGSAAADAVPVLTRLVEEAQDSGDHAGEAARALARIQGDASVPLLLHMLKRAGSGSELRAEAIAALGLVGPGARAAIPVLIDIIQAPTVTIDELVALAEALPVIGAGDQELPRALEAYLPASQGGKRRFLVYVLAKLNAPIDAFGPYLAETLVGRGRGAFSSLHMLQAAVPYGEAIAPAIRQALAESHPLERGRFLIYLIELGPELATACLDAYIASLTADDPDLRQYAARGLALLGPRARRVLPELKALAKASPHDEVRALALKTIDAIETPPDQEAAPSPSE
jgi:hypothetical protein